MPADGIDTFQTTSDDGTRIYVHDNPVVNNDGLHGMDEARGIIGLRAGLHPIRVEWSSETGSRGLEVAWDGRGFGMQVLRLDMLFRSVCMNLNGSQVPRQTVCPPKCAADSRLISRDKERSIRDFQQILNSGQKNHCFCSLKCLVADKIEH